MFGNIFALGLITGFCGILLHFVHVQSYLGYPKPRISERSFERGVRSKKCNGFLTKIAEFATEQRTCVGVSNVHVFVCHTYMFNVAT